MSGRGEVTAEEWVRIFCDLQSNRVNPNAVGQDRKESLKSWAQYTAAMICGRVYGDPRGLEQAWRALFESGQVDHWPRYMFGETETEEKKQ